MKIKELKQILANYDRARTIVEKTFGDNKSIANLRRLLARYEDNCEVNEVMIEKLFFLYCTQDTNPGNAWTHQREGIQKDGLTYGSSSPEWNVFVELGHKLGFPPQGIRHKKEYSPLGGRTSSFSGFRRLQRYHVSRERLHFIYTHKSDAQQLADAFRLLDHKKLCGFYAALFELDYNFIHNQLLGSNNEFALLWLAAVYVEQGDNEQFRSYMTLAATIDSRYRLQLSDCFSNYLYAAGLLNAKNTTSMMTIITSHSTEEEQGDTTTASEKCGKKIALLHKIFKLLHPKYEHTDGSGKVIIDIQPTLLTQPNLDNLFDSVEFLYAIAAVLTKLQQNNLLNQANVDAVFECAAFFNYEEMLPLWSGSDDPFGSQVTLTQERFNIVCEMIRKIITVDDSSGMELLRSTIIFIKNFTPLTDTQKWQVEKEKYIQDAGRIITKASRRTAVLFSNMTDTVSSYLHTMTERSLR